MSASSVSMAMPGLWGATHPAITTAAADSKASRGSRRDSGNLGLLPRSAIAPGVQDLVQRGRVGMALRQATEGGDEADRARVGGSQAPTQRARQLFTRGRGAVVDRLLQVTPQAAGDEPGELT